MRAAPKWRADRWAVRYRGLLLSVEGYYSKQPRIRWEVIGGDLDLDGRATTRSRAEVAAKKAADEALDSKPRTK